MVDCPTCGKPFTAFPTGITLPHFDFRRHFLLFDGGVVNLSVHQSIFLEHLHKHAPEPCTKYSCVMAIWGFREKGGKNSDLNVLVSTLRQKLTTRRVPIVIHTLQGSDHGAQIGPEYDSTYWLTW